MCNIWTKKTKAATRIKNCIDTRKNCKNSFEKDAIWHAYGVIMIS